MHLDGGYPTGGYATGYVTTAVVPAAPFGRAPVVGGVGLAPKIRAIFIPQGGVAASPW